MDLDQIIYLLDTGKFDKLSKLVRSSEDQGFYKLLIRSYLECELGNLNEAEKIAKILKTKASTPVEVFLSELSYANVLYRRGKFEELESLIPKIDPRKNIFSQNDLPVYWSARANELIGMYNHIKGNFEEAYDHYVLTLETVTVIESPLVTDCYINLGEVQIDRGEYSSAFDYFTRALEFSRKYQDQQIEAYSNYNLGRILKIQGKINHALDHFKSAFSTFQMIGKVSGQILSLNNIGNIAAIQGKLELAEQKYNQALELAKKMETDFYSAMIYHNMGLLNFSKRKVEEGISNFENSIQIWTNIGNDLEVSHVLFDLISHLITEDHLTKVAENMEYYRNLVERSKSNSIEARYKLLQSLEMKKNNRLVSVVKAQEILEDLLSNEVSEFSLKIEILVNLLEIKLFELKTFEDDGIRGELDQILDELWKIATSENLVPLQIDILIIKARLALILQDFSKVGIFLEEAKSISDALETTFHTKRVVNISNAIYQEMRKWQKVVDENPDLKERIEESQLLEYLKDVSKKIREFN